MNKENKCYVYGHYFKDNDELFYVGKGTGKRLLKKDRSIDWKVTTKDREWYATIIKDNLSTKESLTLELELIKTVPNLVNKIKSNETKEISDDFLSMFYYDETSPSCLRYAKPSIGISGRIYKQIHEIAGVLKPEPLRRKQRFTVQFNGKTYFAHRVVFGLFNKMNYDTVIDHIDGDSTNNKISNLRQVPQKLNGRNLSSARSNTEVIGVTLTKRKHLDFEQYVASYYDMNGKLKQKEFSTFKMLKQEAFRLACEWRKEQIRLLNEQGAGYTERHGT